MTFTGTSNPRILSDPGEPPWFPQPSLSDLFLLFTVQKLFNHPLSCLSGVTAPYIGVYFSALMGG